MTTLSDSPLSRLLEPLDDLEYTASHLPVSSEEPVEKLFIQLEIPNQPANRRFIVELYFINDVLQAFGGEDDADDLVLAQFTLLMPLVTAAETETELAHCFSLINRITPLGAFGLSQADHAIYLRYTLATESRDLPEGVLIQVLSIFEYLCQEYMPVFDAICAGTLTAESWQDQFNKSGHPIPSMGNPAVLVTES